MDKETKKTTSKRSTSTKKTTTSTKTTTKKPVKKTTTTKTAEPKKSTTKTTTVKKTTPKKTIVEEKKKVVKPEVKEEKVIIKKESKPEEKSEVKDIMPTNYVMICGIIVAFLLIALFLAKSFGITSPKNITKSYLLTSKVVKNELNSSNIETAVNSKQSFILITSLNNEEEYNLEKKLRSIIETNKLQNDFYVFDTNKNTTVDINSSFKLNGKQLKVPTILYYKDGNLVDYINREDNKMMEAADFAKLLDMYELK